MSDRPFYPFEIAEPVSFECPDLCVRTRALSQAELPWIPSDLRESALQRLLRGLTDICARICTFKRPERTP